MIFELPPIRQFAELKLKINGKEIGFNQSPRKCHLNRWEFINTLNDNGQPVGEHSIPIGTLKRVAQEGCTIRFKTSGNNYEIKRESGKSPDKIRPDGFLRYENEMESGNNGL